MRKPAAATVPSRASAGRRPRSPGRDSPVGRDRGRRVGEDRRDRRVGRPLLERVPAREQLVEDDPEREEVGARVELVVPGLLRRDVGDRPDDRPRLRQRPRDAELPAEGLRRHLREAEVEQLDPLFGRHHDVAGLQVAVQDPLPVRVADGFEHLPHETQGFGQRQASLRLQGKERRGLSTYSIAMNGTPAASPTW